VSSLSPVPSEAEEREARRRATWGLGLLALVAVLVVTIGVFALGTSGGDNGSGDSAGQILPTESATSAGPTRVTAHPKPTKRASHSRTPSPTSTHPKPKPTSTANPCPTSAPCTVAGDAGQAVQALNDFRVKHGQPAVPGSVTAGAGQCALREGDGPTCVPHYSWQPVPTLDGAKAVGAVAGTGAGTKWLLDPAMKSFSIGWAYSPGGKHFEFAILKVT
jgi:hypothetical protein